MRPTTVATVFTTVPPRLAPPGMPFVIAQQSFKLVTMAPALTSHYVDVQIDALFFLHSCEICKPLITMWMVTFYNPAQSDECPKV